MYLSISEYGILGAFARLKTRQEPEINLMGYDKNFNLIPQYEVRICGKRYVLDFFVPGAKIAVEIDGREWHSTNKQRENDYDKERNLQTNGYRVLRFTANHAIEKPTDCLVQIYNFYCQLNVDRPEVIELEVVNG